MPPGFFKEIVSRSNCFPDVWVHDLFESVISTAWLLKMDKNSSLFWRILYNKLHHRKVLRLTSSIAFIWVVSDTFTRSRARSFTLHVFIWLREWTSWVKWLGKVMVYINIFLYQNWGRIPWLDSSHQTRIMSLKLRRIHNDSLCGMLLRPCGKLTAVSHLSYE